MSEKPSFWRADGDRKDLDCDGCGNPWDEHSAHGSYCPVEPESEVDALRATIATLRQEVVRLSSDQLVLLNVELAALRALRDRLVAWNRDAPLWHDRNQELADIIATAEKLKE